MKTLAKGFVALCLMACPVYGQGPDLTETLKSEEAILDALDQAVFEARKAEGDLKKAQAAANVAESRLAERRKALEASLEALRKARGRLAVTLRIRRAMGEDPVSGLFLEDERTLRRSVLLERLTKRQAEELKALLEAVKAARTEEFVAAIERANAYASLKAAQEARERLEEEIGRRKAILSAIERDRKLAMMHASALDKAQAAMVASITKRLSGAQGPVDFEALKGKMRWPLQGATVAIPFGDVIHPEFKTRTPHPGVTLSYPYGNERNVRAVAYGRVVFIGRLRGYGLTVVLDHASGYYSVYAGLSEASVKEGAVVREGDILGKVTQIPGERDLKLYFEIRRGNQALDPLQYLSPKQRP